MPPRLDSDLLDAFLHEGSEEAFEELVRRHGPMVLGVCRRLAGSSADADDAAQAVFLTLSVRAASLQRHPCLAGWLHTVSRHVASHWRDSAARRRTHERHAGTLQSGTAASSAGDDTNQALQEALDASIAELPEKYRLPLLLHHDAGCDYRDIASTLNLTISAVGVRLTRAKERLRPLLARRGFAPSEVAVVAALSGRLGETVAPGFIHAATNSASALAAGQAISVPQQVTVAIEHMRRLLWKAQLRLASYSLAGVVTVSVLVLVTHRAFAADAPTPRRAVNHPQAIQEPSLPAAEHTIHILGGGHPFSTPDGRLDTLAFSPDGQLAVTIDTGLSIWKAPSGIIQAHWLNDAGVCDCAWLDGRTIAVLMHSRDPDHSYRLTIIDALSGSHVDAPHQPGVPTQWRSSWEVSPDMHTLLAPTTQPDHLVDAVDLTSGTSLAGIPDTRVGPAHAGILAARFSPDGRQVACMHWQGVSIWDWGSRRQIAQWQFPADVTMAYRPTDMHWSRHGTALRITGWVFHHAVQKTLEFAALDGQLVGEVPGVALYDASERLLGSMSSTGLFTCDGGMTAGRTIQCTVVPSNSNSILFAGFASAEGSLVMTRWLDLASGEQKSVVLDLKQGSQLVLPSPAWPLGKTSWLAFSEDGRLLSSDASHLYAWDMHSGTLLAVATPKHPVRSLVITDIPAFHVVATAGGQSQGVQLWDSSTLSPVGALAAHAIGGSHDWIVGIYADGPLVATVNEYGSVRFHDMRTQSSLREITGISAPTLQSVRSPFGLRGMRVSRDGTIVYLSGEYRHSQNTQASADTLGLTGGWDPRTGKRLVAFTMADGTPIQDAMIDLDESTHHCLLSGITMESGLGTSRSPSGIWDANTGHSLAFLPIGALDRSPVRFSADHQLAYTIYSDQSGDSRAEQTAIDTYDVTQARMLERHGPYPAGDLIASTDGTACVTYVDGKLLLIDLATSATLSVHPLGLGWATATVLALDHDATHAAIGLSDGRIAVVDLFAQPRRLAQLSMSTLSAQLGSPDDQQSLTALETLVALGDAGIATLESIAASNHQSLVAARRAIHGLEWLSRMGNDRSLKALERQATIAGPMQTAAHEARLRLVRFIRSTQSAVDAGVPASGL
jgi:RNA polymerase sigma factor (sigma-70 family)